MCTTAKPNTALRLKRKNAPFQGPSHQAAKRLLLEKEEQRHERAPTYKNHNH